MKNGSVKKKSVVLERLKEGDFFKYMDSRYYDIYRDEMLKRNYSALTYLCKFGILVALCSVISQLATTFTKTFIVNVFMVVYFVAIIAAFLTNAKKMKHYSTLVLYVSEIPVMVMGVLMGTFFDPGKEAITFLLLIIVLPLFILDKPWRIVLYITFWAVSFSICSLISKERPVALYDIIHISGFFIAEIAVELFIISDRFQCVVNYMTSQKERDMNEELTVEITQALSSAIDAKDPYTNGHSERVANYSREIARRAGFSEDKQDQVYIMGLLHDVGKIGIEDSILRKPARLTDEEYAKIRQHPVIGGRILNKIKVYPDIIKGALYHHERYDGRGYPDHLSGRDIPVEARIIGVADSYDAMTSNRSYREFMTQDHVKSEIVNGRSTQFDPEFADIMIDMINEDKDYTMRGL
ncbi:MAG: HD-GYP domain-containing protein [Lachnospiraceae bacterium]|nr:HD-GYP domain-containing protein [Lachnospiraceae bacterium]